MTCFTTVKPHCRAGREGNPVSLLFLVRDTLRAAGLDDRVEEFLRRAEQCACRRDIVTLAKEYVCLKP